MSPENLSTLILLGSFLVMIFLRFPIAYSVGISTVLCLLSMGKNLTVLPMQMVKGVWSFSLMAVPFFITMGVLMGTGGIGLLTPPVGAVLFIGSAVAKRPMEKVVKATLPFYLCMIAALLLISFIPSISLWLPKLTGSLAA